MKNTLALVLMVFVSFGVIAEELTFVCDDVNANSDIPESLLVNTQKNYLIFYKNKFEIYANNETSIMSRYKNDDSHVILEIDKVSGWLKYTALKPWPGSGVYKCSKQPRLMQ